MNLLFFGSSGRQLFGAYHPPLKATSARGAALLCPPWGPEYFVSHRVVRRLATRLSDSGYHVLRFDYYGTGDSAGKRQDGDLASWCEDAAIALDELRDMSGYETAATFGIRLGAVVAWRLAQQRADVHQVVMWDPVVNGSSYLNDLVKAQAEIDRWSLARPRTRLSADGTLHLLGCPLTKTMRAAIEAVQPAEFQQPSKAAVTLFHSEALSDRAHLVRALEAGGTGVHVEQTPGHTWREDEAPFAGSLPHAALERMVELFS
ncbi:MAG: alpha/beta hydrolase [Pseudomonadota bacterium]